MSLKERWTIHRSFFCPEISGKTVRKLEKPAGLIQFLIWAWIIFGAVDFDYLLQSGRSIEWSISSAINSSQLLCSPYVQAVTSLASSWLFVLCPSSLNQPCCAPTAGVLSTCQGSDWIDVCGSDCVVDWRVQWLTGFTINSPEYQSMFTKDTRCCSPITESCWECWEHYCSNNQPNLLIDRLIVAFLFK